MASIDDWFSLVPCSQRFLMRIVDDLKQKSNVLVWIPHYLYAAFVDAMKAQLGQAMRGHLCVSLGGMRMLPRPEALFQQIGLPDGETVGSANWFAAHAQEERIYLIYGDISKESWNSHDWAGFLVRYAHAMRNSESPHACPPLLVVLPGVLPFSQSGQIREPALANYEWRNQTTWSDLYAFAHHLLSRQNIPEKHYRLTVSMAATLSCFDPRLCLFLAEGLQEDRLSPMQLLQRYAETIEANVLLNSQLDAYMKWQLGLMDWQCGQMQEHSVCYLLKDHRALERRIWEAQSGVLFPYIEQERKEIIHRLLNWNLLKFPMDKYSLRYDRDSKDSEKCYLCADDMEIGSIKRLIRGPNVRHDRRLPDDFRKKVDRMKLARDAIAHQKPLDYQGIVDFFDA